MDNIREKLKAVFEFCIDDPYCFPDVDEFIDKLAANGVTVQEWRPASEPPKEDGRYYVARYDYVTKTPFADILWFEKGQWWNRLHGGNFAVTHWMPLPVPPKGVSG